MQWILRAIGVLVVIATLLPLLRHGAWWIRFFDFPRLQIAAAALLVLLALVTVGSPGPIDWAIAAALAVSLIYQLLRILPYTPLYPKQVVDAANAASGEHVSLMVANVLASNRNARRLLDLVESRDPDVLLLVETDMWWQQQLASLEPRYPYSVKHPQDNTYGMHLYSKRPLQSHRLKFLLDDAVPSIHAELLLQSGSKVRIHAVHPSPPAPQWNPSSEERDAELLLVARAVAEHPGPSIVLGDLNDVAWSATTVLFQKISGLLDPRIGRGMLSTFHARYPFLRWPLDHIFFSGDFSLAALERLPAFGSDHFPIYARLRYDPRTQALHEEPVADESDRSDAQERIAKVDVQEKA